MTLVEALRYHASLMIAPEVAPKVRALLNDASTVMWAAAEALSTESETEPRKVWAVLKHFSYEGDDLVGILPTKEAADAAAERIGKESSADKIKVQEWTVGEVNE
jgi:hypothetical protein